MCARLLARDSAQDRKTYPLTAAGVSAGIDLALWLAVEIAGRETAEAIQLVIDIDPHPPFDAGPPSKASKPVQRRAPAMLRDCLPADQKQLMPQIAWRQEPQGLLSGRKLTSASGACFAIGACLMTGSALLGQTR